ncbi:3-oxoacyl-ACP reductase FabG [Sodalis sp. CWE]|uniref:3-oxoacyl-ACP reductase FabG n=1 Tax=Sodalis sp. CWE TaxID=2803816 RepID=UPI001C7D3610|nr:3-oxoacyl-ACP reductase FabG [Sodalis sp. CWE]MBX4181044.1 3-oxoacyl-ACP reductase FabG [Sodalis sp. CWE]
MNLKGKTALVTGSSRGIGRATAEMLAGKGATVIGTATSELGASIVSSYLNGKGKGIELDVSDSASICACLKQIHTEFGSIDILVNNTGVKRDNLLIRMKEDEWQSVLDINLTSVFRISKIVIRSMIKKHYGRIINIGSIVGTIGNIGQANYASSKAGLVGLSRSLAREVASYGITVNIVAPGFISTDMTKGLEKEHREKILSKIPTNRFGSPREVASAVAFFASEEAAYITGEIIHVNGGMCML